MKVVDIVPKDVVVRFELSLSEINSVLGALDKCTIVDANEEDAKSLEILNSMLNDVAKGLKNATI